MQSLRFFSRMAALVGLAGALVTSSRVEAQENPTRVLVDSIHAHNALQVPADVDAYAYHSAYGYRKAFDYLRSRGVQVDEANGGVLETKTLANYQALFINLVSSDLPPFRVSEIAAIKSYVEGGGALFVITDHSNCYYHAYKLLPLFEELGLEVHLETACDKPPAILGAGNGWITITNFSQHPVTQGLHTIAFQTGGTVDDRFAVATTSNQGWGDLWYSGAYGENSTPGFYGNWTQDPGERTGTLGVIAAKTLGKGRILIVADQNLFGDPFLNYADNFQLWLNGMSWLTGNAGLAQSEPYLSWRPHRVVAYEQFSKSAWADTTNSGYFNVFAGLGRSEWIFANSDLSGPEDLILFAHDDYVLPAAALDSLTAHIRSGRNVVVLGHLNNGVTGTEGGLFKQLRDKLGAPTIEKSGNAQSWHWDKSGEVLLLADNRVFRNSLTSPPERSPTSTQQQALAALAELIDGAAAGQKMAAP